MDEIKDLENNGSDEPVSNYQREAPAPEASGEHRWRKPVRDSLILFPAVFIAFILSTAITVPLYGLVEQVLGDLGILLVTLLWPAAFLLTISMVYRLFRSDSFQIRKQKNPR